MAKIFQLTDAQRQFIREGAMSNAYGGMSPIFGGGSAFEKPFRYKFEEGVETFPRRGIGEIFGVETAGEWTLRVRKPTGDDKSFYVINTNMEVVSGSSSPYGFGYFLCANPQYALYNDAATPAFGEIWGPESGSYELTKHRCGFLCLGGPVGSSTDQALFVQSNLGDGRLLVGKADATIAKGTSGTVSRWGGATIADTTINDTVTNNIGDLDTGKWCYYSRPHGCDEYHLISGEC